jgi:membrane peptidoglycan carboxypeptidase
VSPRIKLDADNMPLPNRVPERDLQATRVQVRANPSRPSPDRQTVVRVPTNRSKPRKGRSRWAAFLRSLTLFALGVAGIVIVVGAVIATYGVYEYWRIYQSLPDYHDLQARASSFESTYIYDSSGALLYEINDPNKGRRTRVALQDISPYLIAATIATEDRDYYNHPGFDIVAILKAVYRAWRSGSELAGASTITQQLTRALYFRLAECDKPDAETACYERSFDRKLREIFLAAEINRRYTKEEILELYLNEIYYGNLAYGVEAASETYFNKSAKDLTLGEAAFLAGLPQAPSLYDVYTDREVVLARQKQVVLLMIEASGDCATVGAGGIKVRAAEGVEQYICVTQEAAAGAILDILNRPFAPPAIDAQHPHWVNYIRALLEGQYGQELYRSGYRVYTTLNPALQMLAETEVKSQVDALAASSVTDGALIAIDPKTGFILAMVGSDSYDDPVDGQINMAIRPRQPGSSIKPLTYVAAFEKGWTPATLIWDVPSKFPDGANPPYEPRNYDGRFHGPVRVRDALANSYNIPAVKALEFVGVYDNPDTPEREGLIAFAERLGITTLTRHDYGLALTLGGGETTLLEMTGAYSTLANGGRRVVPVAITRIDNSSGATLCAQPTQPNEVKTSADGAPLPPCQAMPQSWGQQVVRPEHAFLISDILSDNGARALAFGPNSTLRLGSANAAVKTGTTNDYRDNWTVGYTPNLAVGVWVGNADFTPMAQGVSGVTGAGPIWHNVMEGAWAALGIQPETFGPPPGIVSKNICATTGAAENDYCRGIVDPKRPNDPTVRSEFFAENQPPLTPDRDLVAKIFVDKFSGLRASAVCNSNPDTAEEKTVVNLADPFALEWLEKDEQGQKWAAILQITFPVTLAPAKECDAGSTKAVAVITSPSLNQTLDGVIDIFGSANVANGEFDRYVVDWGIGDDPQGWGGVSGEVRNPLPDNGLLARWDTANAPNGPVTLRLLVFDKAGHSSEYRVLVNIAHPATDTPPPPPTATQTNTPLPPTLTPTLVTVATTEAPTSTPVPPTATATTEPATTEAPTVTETGTAAPPTDTPPPTVIPG